MARFTKASRREEGTTSISRVYADVNDKRPPEYWDYESLNVQVGTSGLTASMTLKTAPRCRLMPACLAAVGRSG